MISLTLFDGSSTNITTAKLLGCNFDINSLCTYFSLNDSHSNMVIFMDSALIMKLIRNAFGEKKQFLDGKKKEGLSGRYVNIFKIC